MLKINQPPKNIKVDKNINKINLVKIKKTYKKTPHH